jgi:Leucine-rich repeat (LRR) protein
MSSAITKPRSSYFRATIQGMMLMILIIGVFLGFLADRANKARLQREKLSLIKGFHGQVLFDYQINAHGKYDPRASRPPGPQWLHNLIGPEYFQTIYSVWINTNFHGDRDPRLGPSLLRGLGEARSLHLTHNQLTDDDLTYLNSMPRLMTLDLMRSRNVGDGAAKRIEGLIDLESLYLSDTRITDIGLAAVRGKKLRVLFLDNLPVTDAGLVHLAGITSLQRLVLSGTRITDAGLVHLYGLSNLRELHLEGTNVTGVGVAKLQAALPATKILYSNR